VETKIKDPGSLLDKVLHDDRLASYIRPYVQDRDFKEFISQKATNLFRNVLPKYSANRKALLHAFAEGSTPSQKKMISELFDVHLSYVYESLREDYLASESSKSSSLFDQQQRMEGKKKIIDQVCV
jgi:hypothetical protein